jgi:hypothetical protein
MQRYQHEREGEAQVTPALRYPKRDVEGDPNAYRPASGIEAAKMHQRRLKSVRDFVRDSPV